jgi:glutamine cyclotransferase
VVQARYPHDPSAFTQGLVFADGRFYESTGLYGESTLREVIPESGEVIRSLPLEARYFGEGLALADDRLIQLTWRSGVAFVWDADTFELLDTFRYETEGWGLCFDGADLWMSDGSAVLVRRDPDTFAVRGRVEVTDRGEPLGLLNELECVGDHVYANVWQTDTIVRIDKETGRVAATIDASGLLGQEERAALNAQAVLNGIAWDPETERFWLTGKLWPAVFEVEFARPAATP